MKLLQHLQASAFIYHFSSYFKTVIFVFKSAYKIKMQANIYENPVNEKVKYSWGSHLLISDDYSSAFVTGVKLCSRNYFQPLNGCK